MAQCGAITQKGERCRGVAVRSSEWCPAHHPDLKEKRRRGAKRGGKAGGRGRSRGGKELTSIKGQLKELAENVLAGEVDRADGAVAAQVYNVLLRAISLELKVQEQEELLTRMEALEARAEPLRQRMT